MFTNCSSNKVSTGQVGERVNSISYKVCFYRKFVGVRSQVAGRTPYTFYKPTLGPKYVSIRPYNEFITPTTLI